MTGNTSTATLDANEAVASVAYRLQRSHCHLPHYPGFGHGRACR
jgi:hypothetical protein